MATGQCIEHYGPGEPYLPILEALGQLCRGPAGARLGPLLRQQAPTWLVQMPWLLTQADREHLQQELPGTTRERMLRECTEMVETLTAEIPLLLILEDLHWSDHATLDLMALLARRRAPAKSRRDAFLAESLTAFEAAGRGNLLAEVYRLQGTLLLRQAVSNMAEAEACFQQALTIARRQQAKSWELRTATSLAQLWHQQGKRAEARELLAPIYGWFTEGFDTADLQEAKALLEELGA